MKTRILLSILFTFTFGSVNAFDDCSYYEQTYNSLLTQKENAYSKWINAKYDDPSKDTYYNNYKSLESSVRTTLNTYYTCQQNLKLQLQKADELFSRGLAEGKKGNYESSIHYFQQYLQLNNDSNDPNNKIARGNIVLSYIGLGNVYFEKEQFSEALRTYQKGQTYSFENYDLFIAIGKTYIQLKQYQTGLENFKFAFNEAKTSAEIEESKELIGIAEKMIKDLQSIKDAKTNDPYYFKQYYLDALNIPKAWENVGNNVNFTPIVAVIDDGVSLNHPDLTKNLRTNTNEIPGNGKDDDKNGFIDDYNGRDFITSSNNTLPLGTHGTMVAGIIGAQTNNQEGIAGIAKRVKIMPIGVFDQYGNASQDDIINGMRYAIANGANIINLSLGFKQFFYNTVFDEVIKEANMRGIIVVISAGNGDVLSNNENGVNTEKNKIYPLCNEGNDKKLIIGVGALNQNGYRANRSNYGFGCVDFFTFGEQILSTSIKIYADEDYTAMDGTSFSAPIVAGIIALGYNKFGKVAPSLVYDTLVKSLVKNNVGNYGIDANIYIKELENLNKEFADAVKWMYDNGLTSYNTTQSFRGEDRLTREQAAKFFVQFGKTVLNKNPDSSMKSEFKDINNTDITLRNYVLESFQMGLFKGTKGFFNPNLQLTKAQALAVLIRSKNGLLDESGDLRYSQYYNTAVNMKLLDGLGFSYLNLDSEMISRREIAILLYRLSQLKI